MSGARSARPWASTIATVARVAAHGLALRAPDTGRPWSYDGHAPHDADWNERAAARRRPLNVLR